ncbi:SRPBCC family protein [bacterium]|nr:SRPBCC family protein [bacterium]MBU1615869.1 SRPBCC family protein [bacterium]
MKAESSIVIKASVDKVFRLLQNVEKFAELIPGKQTRVLKKEGDKVFTQSTVKLMGKEFKHASVGTIKENEFTRFKQIQGLLKGMETECRVEEVKEGTLFRVIHSLNFPIPLIGDMIARLIYFFIIERMVDELLPKIKTKIEEEES